MYLPPTKSQSLEAPPSDDPSGRVDFKRAVVYGASLTLQSRTPGRLFDSLELVCSPLWFASGQHHTQSNRPVMCQLAASHTC